MGSLEGEAAPIHPVLLLDEPLGALDRQLREEMQVELRELQQSVGITTIFVTHDQEEALTISDRIVVINRGLIEQVGRPGEIYERPRTELVANFIGVSNAFEGVVSASHCQTVVVQAPEGALTVRGTLPAGRRVKIVVRPEKIHLSEHASPGLATLKARVHDVICLGTHSRYFVVLATGKRVIVYEQNRPDQRGQARGPGDDVYVSWDPDHAVILPETL